MLAAVGQLVDRSEPVRDERAFDALVGPCPSTSSRSCARGVLLQVLRVLGDWRLVEKALHGRVELDLLPAMTDLRGQLGGLVHDGFVGEAGAEALREYPRYLAAMQTRIDRLGDRARDRELMDRVLAAAGGLAAPGRRAAAGTSRARALRRVRWLLEEYRVSLWAQQLGTPVPVSDTRIRKALG